MKKDKIYWYISLIISILASLAMFASLSDDNRHEFFNSDCLFLPHMYKDIFWDGGHLKGWSLGTTPNVYPSILTYFIFATIIQNLMWAHFLHGLFLFISLLCLTLLLLRKFTDKYYYSGTIFNLLICLFPLFTLYQNDFIITTYLYLPYHIGAYLVMLLNIWLLISYIESNKKNYLILYSISTIFIVFSNQIYIVSGICFLITLYFIAYLQKRKSIWTSFYTTLFSIVLGVLLLSILKWTHYFSHSQSIVFDFSRIIPSISLQIFDFYKIFWNGNILTIIVLICISTLLIHIFRIREIQMKNFVLKNTNTIFISFFVFLYAFGQFFSVGLTSMYFDSSNIRYYISVFYLLLAFFSLQFPKKFDNIHFLNKIVISLFIFFASLLFKTNFSNFPKQISSFGNYYPHRIQQIDSVVKVRNLKYGLASYWDAVQMKMLSKTKIRLHTVNSDFSIVNHNVNPNSFFKGYSSVYDNPKFNFIIENQWITQDVIIFYFGNPKEIIKLKDRNIFIYPEFTYNLETGKPNRKLETEKNIFCDFESIDGIKKIAFSNDTSIKFSYTSLSFDNSFSGKNALKLNKDEMYALGYKIDAVSCENAYEIELWTTNEKSIMIAASIKSVDDFYLQGNECVGRKDNNWKRIKLFFKVPQKLDGQPLSIYLYKPLPDEVLVDDFKISVQKIRM